MTWRRMLALGRHWKLYPPVHIALVKLFTDGSSAPAPRQPSEIASTGNEVMAFLAQSGGRINILDP